MLENGTITTQKANKEKTKFIFIWEEFTDRSLWTVSYQAFPTIAQEYLFKPYASHVT